MTVKHKGKNVSAENEEILIDLTMSPDGILSLIKKNQYTGESNLNDPDTIDLTGIRLRAIPLENMAALNALEADSTKEEYKKTHIFLVPATTNDEGTKAEYIYIEKDNHTWGFEKIGSTNIDLTTKLDISQTSYKGKNVVVDGTTGNITFENKPTIPQASSSTPLKDTTNGAIGSSTSWATANHQHPKSDLYAEATHFHTKSQITDFPSLANVATSGSYNDLNNKPNIPSKISDLTDDSDFIEKSNTTGLIKNDGTIDTSHYLTEHQDISGKVNYTDIVDNLKTSDSGKPLSAKQGKALADMIGEIQAYVNR